MATSLARGGHGLGTLRLPESVLRTLGGTAGSARSTWTTPFNKPLRAAPLTAVARVWRAGATAWVRGPSSDTSGPDPGTWARHFRPISAHRSGGTAQTESWKSPVDHVNEYQLVRCAPSAVRVNPAGKSRYKG
jgi:hypothetical protein